MKHRHAGGMVHWEATQRRVAFSWGWVLFTVAAGLAGLMWTCLQVGCITVQRGAVEVYVGPQSVGQQSAATRPAASGPAEDWTFKFLDSYLEAHR
jgi:hypothetical protein